jgi:EpsD family peptidyl-prolyl cis-trans isomerase
MYQPLEKRSVWRCDPRRIQPRCLGALLLGTALVLVGCDKGDAKKPATQIAAKVNGEEISVHQINGLMARAQAAPEQTRQVSAQLLEHIIDQELLVQKARDAKLDRDPQVMQAIEGAKRQILAQAYVDRAVSASLKASADEAKAFYAENPALFQQRRLYRLHELIVAAPEDKLDSVKAYAANAKNLNDVAAWLKGQSLPFNVATSTRPAEQIPLDVLPAMMKMKNGQIAAFPSRSGASVVQLVQSEEAPLTEQQAMPIIEHFIANRKRLQLASTEVKRLRENAKIEYVGDFEATRPGEPAQPGSSNKGAISAKTHDAGFMERGLSGLR